MAINLFSFEPPLLGFADGAGIVYITDIHHPDSRIIVYKIIKFPGARHKGSNRPAAVQFFQAVVNHSFIDQRYHAVRKHFRVRAQVFMARQVFLIPDQECCLYLTAGLPHLQPGRQHGSQCCSRYHWLQRYSPLQAIPLPDKPMR